MTVYAIVLNDPNEYAWEQVRETWPDHQHYILTDRIAFVVTEGVTLTTDIASTVGMNKEHQVTGFILDADSRAGWNDRGFVEWLRKVS